MWLKIRWVCGSEPAGLERLRLAVQNRVFTSTIMFCIACSEHISDVVENTSDVIAHL